MKVTKMHALGNNYIYVSEFEESIAEHDLPALARTISDVRKGIGSDGLILIGPSTVADVRMRIFNADGSEAETCGNGLRCVAKYAFEHGYVRQGEFRIETRAGVVGASVHAGDDTMVDRVTIDMGEPVFGGAAIGWSGDSSSNAFLQGDDGIVSALGEQHAGTLVSMGNPHFVSFVPDATGVPVDRIGPVIEQLSCFSQRINVEFVTPRNRSELDFRVWERGSGITYACGTGACASVAAGIHRGYLDHQVTVHLLGGDLEIEWRDGRLLMTGDAVVVLTGDYQWPRTPSSPRGDEAVASG